MDDTKPKAFLDISDIRQRLNISDSTVRVLIKTGELPAFKIAGRYRFDPTEVQTYIDRSRVA